METNSLFDYSDDVLRRDLVKESGYGYVLISEDYKLVLYSNFITQIYPQIQLLKRGDSIVDFQPIMSRILYHDEYGSDAHKLEEHGMLLDCKVSLNKYNSIPYYFIEWWDETIKYEIMETDSKYIRQLNQNVQNTIEEVYRIQSSIVMGMATMVESRDNSTGGHVMRVSLGVSIFINRLSNLMQLKKDFWGYIKRAAPLHDIGKIAIDDDILRKPGKFTDSEFEFMKEHTTQGARMLETILSDVNDPEFREIAINIAKYHHERYDGSGYPEGLKGENIPFEARVLALADVFDALVCRRVYKEAFDYDRAFRIITEEMGSQFDPFLCGVFLECKKELIELYDSLSRE